ncbi:tyrosine-type recombinase/integrase [Candidatus Deianiraea vastatrix]|uniref:Phage integrase n=1 Tax=Candidatus Deianiraea vastatrix TaxID=2163644 RepID=A0A5B8XC91_9RICK|nr:site-specific integrase [Candidatus Deianiraea vastatrix]QED22952.1 Putative phage integrase [Candidatus Deianiraea vastatrix]
MNKNENFEVENADEKSCVRGQTFLNFTKKAISEISPSKTNTNYHDLIQKGLFIVVYPSGTKVFWTRKMINGRQKKFKIGNFPDISIENARKKVAEFRGKIAIGEDPTLAKYNFSKEKTFKQVFDEYIEKHAKIRKRTWQEDVIDIEQYFKDWFNRKACTITKEEIRDFHSKLGIKHPFRANRLIQKLSSIFNKAIEFGWNHTNPVIGIKKFPEPPRDRSIDPKRELESFMRSLELEQSRTAKDFILISALTAVRKSNILEMKWSDINDLNTDDAIWKIERTKNGKPHIVPLPSLAREILQSRFNLENKDNVWVFNSERGGHFTDPKSCWRRVLKRAGIKDLRIHDLRRNVATNLNEIGINYFTIKDVMGHSSKDVTSIYARTRINTLRDTLEKQQEFLLENAKGINKWW